MRWVAGFAAVAAMALSAPPPAAADAETDRLMLEQAGLACAAGEFRSFFEAFVRSPAVQARHTAATVTLSVDGQVTQVPRDAYTAFPVGLIDYQWVSKASEQAILADPAAELEHLKMEWNQSQTNIWRIDWVRVRYDGQSEGGDDPGNEIGTYGKPGYLLFNPTETCWELTQDSVGGPDAGLSEP